jgi:hypothetical protein
MFAIFGIAAGFLLFLTIPGWFGVGAWRRYRRGEPSSIRGWSIWGMIFTPLTVVGVIVGMAASSAEPEKLSPAAADALRSVPASVSPAEPTSPAEPEQPPSTPSPSAGAPDAAVNGFPDAVNGSRISLRVLALSKDAECREGAFRPVSRYVIAYYFACADIAGARHDPYLFYILIRNTSFRPADVALSRFIVSTRDGDSQAPVNIRGHAARPEVLLPPHVRLAPGDAIAGWVVFDGRLRFVPARLSYVDRAQTVSVEFRGTHQTFR